MFPPLAVLGVKILTLDDAFVIRNASGEDVFFAPREAVSAVAFEDSMQAATRSNQPA